MKKTLKIFKIRVSDAENKELFSRKSYGTDENDAIERLIEYAERNRLMVDEKFPITFETIKEDVV